MCALYICWCFCHLLCLFYRVQLVRVVRHLLTLAGLVRTVQYLKIVSPSKKEKKETFDFIHLLRVLSAFSLEISTCYVEGCDLHPCISPHFQSHFLIRSRTAILILRKPRNRLGLRVMMIGWRLKSTSSSYHELLVNLWARVTESGALVCNAKCNVVLSRSRYQRLYKFSPVYGGKPHFDHVCTCT